MSAEYSIEQFLRVYHDGHGYYWEIRPDRDALGCVEVLYCENDGKGKSEQTLIVPPEAARLIAAALLEVAGSVESNSQEDMT